MAIIMSINIFLSFIWLFVSCSPDSQSAMLHNKPDSCEHQFYLTIDSILIDLLSDEGFKSFIEDSGYIYIKVVYDTNFNATEMKVIKTSLVDSVLLRSFQERISKQCFCEDVKNVFNVEYNLPHTIIWRYWPYRKKEWYSQYNSR